MGSHSKQLGARIALFILLVVAPMAVVLSGYRGIVMSLSDFLPLHAAMEGVAVVVSILIFVIHWNSLDRQNCSCLLISCSFLIAGLIYFFHIFGYVGMPALVTENSNHKGIFFGIVACGFTAIGLVAASMSTRTTPASKRFRYGLFILSLAITGVVFWIGTFHLDWIPPTDTPGVGVTAFKRAVDGCWLVLFSLAGVGFYRNREDMKGLNIGMAITACAVAAASQILLMAYRNPNGTLNILAHVYRVAAYWMFYKVVFVSHFQAPHVRLEESEKQLKRAIKIRDEFLSIASHELRTPLTPLRVRLQLIQKSLKNEKSSTDTDHQRRIRMIGNAEGELERMTRLVNNMLDVATVRSGQLLNLKLKPCSLADIVRSVTKRVQQEFDSTHTSLELDIRYEGKGEWDELRLEQVVTNLVSNALKYARGSVVQIRVIEEQSGVVSLIVRDHGPGIPEKYLCDVFGLFQRGSESKGTPGLGLGLYIVKNIVEMLGGTVTVNSKVGEGTTFTVRLPLRPIVQLSEAA